MVVVYAYVQQYKMSGQALPKPIRSLIIKIINSVRPAAGNPCRQLVIINFNP